MCMNNFDRNLNDDDGQIHNCATFKITQKRV